MTHTQPSTPDDFKVAIVCALETEYDAARLIFDEFWDLDGDVFRKTPNDSNHYATGRVGNHNVVIVRMSQERKVAAERAATDLCSSYPKLRLALLVGLCGAVPTSPDGNQIILGDVIICDAIVEYDFESERFVYKETVSNRRPRRNVELRNLVGTLKTARGIEMMDMTVSQAFKELEAKDKQRDGDRIIKYPGASYDRLYQSTHRHRHHDTSLQCECVESKNDSDPVCEEALSLTCDELGCDKDQTQLITRVRLKHTAELELEDAPTPMVHIGWVASGDTTMKSAADRDDVAKETDVIGFEVEGAGIWDEVSCIVVKGVCDYADGHKQENWHKFASATAASASKAILEWYNPKD